MPSVNTVIGEKTHELQALPSSCKNVVLELNTCSTSSHENVSKLSKGSKCEEKATTISENRQPERTEVIPIAIKTHHVYFGNK